MRASTRGDNFSMTVKNETFIDRVKAGPRADFLAAALKPFESSKPLGSIGGFPISIDRFDERVTLLIQGKHSYRANVSDSASGIIASLEHALTGIEDRLWERERGLAQSLRQASDLSKQVDQPFEHYEKLASTIARQQEIIAALHITKNQASARVDQSVEHKPHASRESVEQAIQEHNVVWSARV